MQFNANGIGNKLTELGELIHKSIHFSRRPESPETGRTSFGGVGHYSQTGSHRVDHYQRLHISSKLLHRRLPSHPGLSDDDDRYPNWLPTTQPTRGGAVTAVWQTLCKLCQPLPSPAIGARLPFSASRPCGPAGRMAMLLRKAGDVETNPGPTTTHKVWICDICHRQVRKQISIRCTGIHLAQYTDTWICHQHR